MALGEHGGLANYTIGQRKGLGISHREPLYVLAMNPYRNALVVGLSALNSGAIAAASPSASTGSAASPPSAEPFRAEVKIRYRSRPQAALVAPLASEDRMRGSTLTSRSGISRPVKRRSSTKAISASAAA